MKTVANLLVGYCFLPTIFVSYKSVQVNLFHKNCGRWKKKTCRFSISKRTPCKGFTKASKQDRMNSSLFLCDQIGDVTNIDELPVLKTMPAIGEL